VARITFSAGPSIRIRAMALQLPRATVADSISRQLSNQLMDRATALRDVAVALSIDWDQMEHPTRTALVRKIQRLAFELSLLAGRTKPTRKPNAPENLSPWVGLHFLTPREHEVLRALSLGTSTKKMGELLGISSATVRSHVKNILPKLGVHSRVEAVSLLLTWDAHQTQPALGESLLAVGT